MKLFVFVVFDLLVAFVAAPGAQTQPGTTLRDPSAPRTELSVGAGFLSGSDLGDADAELRGRTGPFQLFTTSSRLGASVPLEVRLDFPLGRRFALEVRGAWSRPEVQTSVSDDVEGAPPITLTEQTSQYSLDAGLLYYLARPRPRALLPFVSGSVGYVGTVHEDLTLLENGIGVRGGGGVKMPLATGGRGRISGYGIRADAVMVVLANGVASGNATTHVAMSGSFYLAF
jgi:hypothetical protein